MPGGCGDDRDLKVVAHEAIKIVGWDTRNRRHLLNWHYCVVVVVKVERDVGEVLGSLFYITATLILQ
jgi:hypothetical protein